MDELLAIVQGSSQDLTWQSRYESEQDLVRDLRDHAGRLARGDVSRLSDLRFLLLPTGALCEIAASSGWLERYVSLANRLDASSVWPPT
ncbi:hypothetical protein [Nonomuraea typhae]|uniref:hypothetical protein n=1 Tax=Nonomuraea typhae TaxID=2603600 RepID=UPI0012F87F20|nr:hypothetical protein [Nonomuraea typhae]